MVAESSPSNPNRKAAAPEIPAASAESAVEVWLDGEVVGCGCPDCGAPMAVRMWLRLADCFRCGTSIELSEEILQRAKPRPTKPPRRHEKKRPVDASLPVPPPPPPHGSRLAQPGAMAPSRAALLADLLGMPASSALSDVTRSSQKRTSWVFRDMPAWIISGLLHLAALLILAMFVLEVTQEEPPTITLSIEVDPTAMPGGQTESPSNDEVDFDLPLDPNDLPETHDARVKLAQDARELRLDAHTVLPNAQPIESVKAAIASPDPNRRALALRDPRVRAEVARREGGTTLTEAAVTRGLRWMAMHQNDNGSWSLDQFHRAGDCQGRCDGQGHIRSDTAATALALLPFLGAGQTHFLGAYQSQVAGGLQYLISIQKENGDLRGQSGANSGMYAHGQAALVLCEAYKMTGDEKLHEPAQKAIQFIVDAQHLSGGWRYRPYYERGAQAPDTSVLGWQVLAIYSAKAAYLDLPDSAMQLAAFYLDQAQTTTTVRDRRGKTRVVGRQGGLYGYLPKHKFKPSMTAEGLLCRMMMGWKLDHPGIQEGVGMLLDHHLPRLRDRDLYYWYYGTQAMHHVGGKSWSRWNVSMRAILVQSQEKSGHQAGSWPPSLDQHGRQGGRLYTTAFATAILEVYYRHAPLFRQIDLE